MTDTDADAPTSLKHEILKKKEAIPRPYVVEIGDSGPAQITVSGLRSGGSHSFNRLTDDESDHRAILHLTDSERRSLAESGFTIMVASPDDLVQADVFPDVDGETADGETADGDTGDTSDDALSAADWPLKTTPIDYLTANPDGPKADLAQRMIDAGFGDVSASST